jgi:rhodanese-related sulfurtransferase
MARGIVAALIAFVGIGCTEPNPQAIAMVEQGATLVDVRTPGEFAGGHIRNALNIPVQELAGRIDELDSSKAVVVYCRSGARSSAAASTLRAQGFEVYDLGAMSSWGVSEDIVR